MSAAVSPAFPSASVAVCSWVAQISVASCSTQPGVGKIWRNSFCANATTLPLWSNTMARELVVPWSRARMYFTLPPGLVHERRDQAADNRSGHRYPRIAPVRIALARDRQQRMSDSRTQVTRRVDRVTGRPAQRQPDGPHEDADQEWAESRIPTVHRVEILRREDGQYTQHQHEGADDLGEHIRSRIADGGGGAKHGQLPCLVLGHGPVRQVGEPDDRGTEERAQHLRYDIDGHRGPRELADGSEADGYGGVQMRTAEGAHRIHPDRHAERPPRGDDDPPAVLAFGLVEHHVSDHAVAQDDQQHGAEHFCEKWWHRVDWEAAKVSARRRLVYTAQTWHHSSTP